MTVGKWDVGSTEAGHTGRGGQCRNKSQCCTASHKSSPNVSASFGLVACRLAFKFTLYLVCSCPHRMFTCISARTQQPTYLPKGELSPKTEVIQVIQLNPKALVTYFFVGWTMPAGGCVPLHNLMSAESEQEHSHQGLWTARSRSTCTCSARNPHDFLSHFCEQNGKFSPSNFILCFHVQEIKKKKHH